MEKLTYCDTHVLVWLYAGDLSLFPRSVVEYFDSKTLIISPAVILELEYLYEIGKIQAKGEKILKTLEKSLGLKSCPEEFGKVIHEALKQSWTRDPFDRLIVSQAAITKSPLLTKDALIHKHYPHALWG